jgi:hypothetical protein
MQEPQTRERTTPRADVDPAYIALGEQAAPRATPRPGRSRRLGRGIAFIVGVGAILAVAAMLGGWVPAVITLLAISAAVIFYPRFAGR